MKEKERMYIAGGISNIPIKEVKNNFDKAKRDVARLGYQPVSPFDVYLGDRGTWEEYMTVCIPLLSVCECIYMQKNWKESSGAKIEHDFALSSKKLIIYED